MRKILLFAALAAFVSMSSGCATMSRNGNKIGAVAGAAIGYAVGGKNKLIGVLLGGAVGWKVGDIIGKRFGPNDAVKLDTTLRNNASGQTARWGAADGSYYELTPNGNGYTPQPGSKAAKAIPAAALPQSYCREFTLNVVMAGRTEQAYGTACMMPDGSWRIVN